MDEDVSNNINTDKLKENLTDLRDLQCLATQRFNDVDYLTTHISELRSYNTLLEKKIKDLETGAIRTFETERLIRDLQIKVENNEKERLAEREKYESRIIKIIEEKKVMKEEFELEMSKKMKEIQEQKVKIEAVTEMEKGIQRQNRELEEFKLNSENFKNYMKNEFQVRGVNALIKFDELKKQMRLEIEDTKNNIKNINLENMEVSTKLTLLQNQQLLVELSYQSDQLIELFKKNEKQEKIIFSLINDIEIHKEVEFKLAEKNRKLSELVNTSNSNNTGSPNNESYNISAGLRKKSTFNNILTSENNVNNIGPSLTKAGANISINNNLKEMNLINSFEVKIKKLEAELLRKQEEFSMLKYNLDLIQEKLISYEKKYSAIFAMFEEGIKKLIEENGKDELNNNEFYLNFDLLKVGEYESLPSDQKYSLLIVLMRFILPLVNPIDLQNTEFVKNNLNQVKIKYHFLNKNNFNEVLFKKAGVSPLNALGIGGFGLSGAKGKSSMDKLPLLKNKRVNSVTSFQYNIK